MSLKSTVLLNGVSVVFRLISSLIVNKILAIYIGPSGYAVIGQFQNLVSIVVSLSGGIISAGVIKATAQNFSDPLKQQQIWKTALRLSLIVSVLTGGSLLLLQSWIERFFLLYDDLSLIFTCLALSVPTIAINNVLLAIINGKKEVTTFVVSNILTSSFSLVVTACLVIYFELLGAMISYTVVPVLTLLATAFLINRKEWFSLDKVWGSIELSSLHELKGYAFMGITSALAVPITHTLIRNLIVEDIGLEEAGYWQAMWRISSIYLMLITTTMGLYYLPRIAEIDTASEMKSEIVKVSLFVIPITIIGALAIFIMRDYVISVLFTESFYLMRNLFAWQLLGDVLKVVAWILGYVLLGRAMTKLFVISEILSSVLFYTAAKFFIDNFGLQGVSIAHAVNYLLFLLFLLFFVSREINSMRHD